MKYFFFQSGIKCFVIKKIIYFLVDTLNSNTTQIKNSDGKWSDDEDEVNFDAMNTEEEYSPAEIINQCDFGQRHLIDACISSNTTLLQQEGLKTFTETSNSGLNLDDVNGDIFTMHTIQMFLTMLKLISGTLVGGAHYSDIYVRYRTNKFTLPVMPLTVLVWKLFCYHFW